MSDTVLTGGTSNTETADMSQNAVTDQGGAGDKQPADTSTGDNQSTKTDDKGSDDKDQGDKSEDNADGKSGEADGDEGKGDKQTEEKDAETGAPESYADFTLLDGVTVDEKSMVEFKALAKELNLTQEAAQKFVTLQNQMAVAQAEAYENQVTEWANSAKSDKEYGGKDFEANQALARKGLAKFGTPELVSYLNDTKLGNHPEVVRTFYRIGKALEEGSVKRASDNAGGGSSAGLQSIYTN